MHIQIINFALDGVTEMEYREMVETIAPAFADLPGLVSKTWLADSKTNMYGGVYVWESREAMEEYKETDIYKGVLANPYFGSIIVKDFAVLEGPSRVTRGSLRSGEVVSRKIRSVIRVPFRLRRTASERIDMNETSLISERIERAAFADLHAAAPEETREKLGLSLENIETATLSIARNEPDILLNRAIGLGVEEPDVRESVERIASRYAEEGVGRYFLHLHPAARPPELRGWIEAAGLVRARGWMKFRRDPIPPPDASSELRVERIGAGRAPDFGRIVAECFGLSGAAAPLFSSLANRRGWRLYMSFEDDEPAGTGALFIRDDVAWLDMGATLPAFRKRGGQSAVMRRRVLDAIGLGCRAIFTTTGEEVEGDPQHSYKNIERMGFRPVYVRENFAPARR